ncbi:hypothetical protein [Marivirga sp.]|nr:hypothetical protein [Marivirga sp.]
MEDEKPQTEKRFSRKGFVAIVVLSIAAFGLYNMILDFLKYLGII